MALLLSGVTLKSGLGDAGQELSVAVKGGTVPSKA